MKESLLIVMVFFLGCRSGLDTESWVIETQEDWQDVTSLSENLEAKHGQLHLQGDSGFFLTKLKKFQNRKKLRSLTLRQAPGWHTWKPIPKVTPEGAEDAPVFIPAAPGDYWFLALFQGDDANGYHSWHSKDMKTWEHYGPVSTRINRWVTSAEYVDGKFYIYFDKPNDEDPHLVIDSDLTDGRQGKEMGMVFDDPSHGSDMAIFRDDDGRFHLIYEDWSPINPRTHSWDSPLAGHADSPDGINGFEPHAFPEPIDRRTKPTGKIEPYEPHSNQLIPGIDLSPYTYEVHEGPQDAFGDYTMIKVGRQYYLFCDYDPHEPEKSMRIGRWRSDDINKPFVWDGEIGEGFHPDPTIGFAEGRFYLLVQRHEYDFMSDGPWVNGVGARAGVDTNNDGEIDQWTEFTRVKEIYVQKEGFARVIEARPAALDVSLLKAGYAFQIELRIQRANGASPVLDAVEADFQ